MTSSTRIVLSVLMAAVLVGCGGSSATPTSRTAAASTPPSGPFAATGSLFALSVADLDATTKWYVDKLGLRVTRQPAKANGTQVVILEGTGLTVELLKRDAGVPLSRIAPAVHDRMLVHGIVKVGMAVDDLDAAIAALQARSVPIAFGPFPATADQRANLIIRDNEGNLIQLLGK